MPLGPYLVNFGPIFDPRLSLQIDPCLLLVSIPRPLSEWYPRFFLDPVLGVGSLSFVVSGSSSFIGFVFVVVVVVFFVAVFIVSVALDDQVIEPETAMCWQIGDGCRFLFATFYQFLLQACNRQK